MPLPNLNITPIPDTDPDAVPALWNTRYSEIDENFSYLLSALQEQEGNAEGADEAVKLAWLIQEAKIEIEQWTDNWRLHDPLVVPVTAGVAGDDSVDVESTANLEEGREYVITDGVNSETLVVNEILTTTRFTAVANLTHSYSAGADIVGCQWSQTPRLASPEAGEVCYFLTVNVGEDSVDKQVIIRKETGNDCTIRVYFKDGTHATWTECTAGTASAIRGRTDFEDLPYTLPASGDLELKLVCEAGSVDSTIDIELIAVMRPFNVNIEIHDEDTEAHPDIRTAIETEVSDHDAAAGSHAGGLDIIDTEIAAHDADPSAHGLDVLFPEEAELMPNAVDRELSGASAWTNVDFDSYDETDDLSVTASAADQYCTLPVASCPMTVGDAYTLQMTVANLVSTFTIKSFDGAQDLGTIDENGVNAIPFSASTTGGLRIVADTETSSADFDNFSLKEAANWEPVIEFKVGQHNESESAHPYIQGKISDDIDAHDTDTGDSAHPSIRNKITTDIGTHNSSGSAHNDIRTEIDNDIDAHNTDAENNAHPAIRNKIGVDIAAHNVNSAAHADIRGEIDTDITAHDTDAGDDAHPTLRSKISTDIASHNSNGSAHNDIRTAIGTQVSAHNTDAGNDQHPTIRNKISTDISTHNSNASAHSAIRSTINGNAEQGGWKTIREVTSGMTAAAGDLILANTTSGAFTVTLPSSPSVGDAVGFIDVASTFDTNNLTIGRNGKTIMGLSQNLACDIENAAFILVYTSNGWRIG